MKLKVGDDGELDFIEVEEKPKRKRKSPVQRRLQGCGRLLSLMVILVLSVIGGFAANFVLNPIRDIDARNMPCATNIKTLSVAGGAALFLSSNGTRRTLISLDGKSFQTIDRTGEVDSLNLANDEKHVAESRREPVAPYFFIYTWTIDDLARWNEQLLTYGQYPSWSPDGKQIAFLRIKATDRSTLYVMNADGSNIRLLRKTWFVSAPASWSPDGTQLAFSTSEFSEMTQNIYIINIADGAERKLFDSAVSVEAPAWSPDGKSIAYISRDVYTINSDGSNRRNLTNSRLSFISNMGWSSDSMSIGFLAQDSTNKQGIYVMDSDGAGLHVVYNRCP